MARALSTIETYQHQKLKPFKHLKRIVKRNFRRSCECKRTDWNTIHHIINICENNDNNDDSLPTKTLSISKNALCKLRIIYRTPSACKKPKLSNEYHFYMRNTCVRLWIGESVQCHKTDSQLCSGQNLTWNHIYKKNTTQHKIKQRNDGLLRLEVWRKVFTWFQWMAEWNNDIEPNTGINVFFDDTLGQSVEMEFLGWCWFFCFFLSFLSHLPNELNINSLLAFQKCGVDQENEMSMLFGGSAFAHTKC